MADKKNEKVRGLSQDTWSKISKVCILIGEAQKFDEDQFSRMVKGFEAEDKTVHKILIDAVEAAEDRYTVHLNSKILGSSSKYMPAESSMVHITDTETVLGKALCELRSNYSNGKEYRQNFVVPAIKETAREFDKELRRQAHEDRYQNEISHQNEWSNGKNKSGRSYDFGL